MRRFKHLTWTDRLRIEKWLNEGMKPKDIASKLRVHISTVYNELHRGEYQRLVGDTWEFVSAYSPDIAEQKYQAHLRDKGPALKIGKDHELANYIETTILNKECSRRRCSDMRSRRASSSRRAFLCRRYTTI